MGELLLPWSLQWSLHTVAPAVGGEKKGGEFAVSNGMISHQASLEISGNSVVKL